MDYPLTEKEKIESIEVLLDDVKTDWKLDLEYLVIPHLETAEKLASEILSNENASEECKHEAKVLSSIINSYFYYVKRL